MANAQLRGETRASVRRLLLVIALAAAGLFVSVIVQGAFGVDVRQFADSLFYGKLISALLVVGLFASAFGISRRELRRNARIVLVAVTAGVAVKAGLVGAIMALVYGSAGYLLLGVAVAQIDPLSVAATLRHSGMSERAKSILSAWASFDDPVTVLLVFFGSYAISGGHRGVQGSAGSYLSQIVLNAALIAVAAVGWYVLAVLCRGRVSAGIGCLLQCLVLAGLLAVAAAYGLLVGITVCGLFFRPPVGAAVDCIVGFAFYGAAFLLGMLLVEGVNVPAGILLGASVCIAQVFVALAVTRGLPRADRVHLMLGQQNGLTAIVLGLALQPYVPQAVGTIAIAILTVNVIHIYTNRRWGPKSQVSAAPSWKDGRSARPLSTTGSRLAQVPEKRRSHVALTVRRHCSDGRPNPSSYIVTTRAKRMLGVAWRGRGRCSLRCWRSRCSFWWTGYCSPPSMVHQAMLNLSTALPLRISRGW
jgi:Sodium/hydrogen exchanger family